MSRFRLARNKQILHFLETSLVFFCYVRYFTCLVIIWRRRRREVGVGERFFVFLPFRFFLLRSFHRLHRALDKCSHTGMMQNTTRYALGREVDVPPSPLPPEDFMIVKRD